MRPIRKRPSGWRTLRVGELELWWTVGEPRVIANLATEPGHAPTQTITLSLVVERADGSGKKLVATIRGRRGLAIPSAGFGDVQSIAVEPSAVRRLVELAAPRGAWPTGVGSWQTELELPERPLPDDLAFRPEHLDALTLVWRK
ncbi:MAG TPA: hypothetical protein VGO00_29445 [Kofleriaceae bacterium]|nr:hypothetical protein [Kofleriaceae bacterium]